MFVIAKFIGKRFPYLKPYLLPIWKPLRHFLWISRNVLFRNRPIEIPIISEYCLYLYPVGQIAELMWGLEFERKERDFVANFLRPGMRVVNVGANVGLYTIMSAILVGTRGAVYAFEPASDTFERLSMNVSLNNVANVSATKIAISDHKGDLVLKNDPVNPNADGHRFVERVDSNKKNCAKYEEIIESDTLDNFLSNASGGEVPVIDLFIIDVEGAEWPVLKGAIKCLTESRKTTLLLECTKNQTEVMGFLDKNGFAFYTWDQISKRLLPCDFLEAAARGDVIAKRD